MEMSKQSRFSINYKLTYKIIALVLVLGMAINFAIPAPQANAEAITVTIAVVGSILALIAGAYGLTVTYGSIDAAVKDFWTAEAQDFISRSPTWSQVEISSLGIAWLSSRLENPSLLLDDMTISFCNDFFYDWCNTKHNIQENDPTPVILATTLSDVFVTSVSDFSITSYTSEEAAISYLYNHGLKPTVFQSNESFIYNYYINTNKHYITVTYNNYQILSGSFTTSYSGVTPLYICYNYPNRNLNVLTFYESELGRYHNILCGSFTSDGLNLLSNITASLPGDYSDQTVPQVDYGTALSYTGAPETTYEDFLETGIEEILLDTYDPTLTEDIPWDEPIPTPATDTTWEDGALGFWQAVGGAVTGGLSTAGQSVRQWIQSMHSQMVQYWEALLEWCDGIVGAIEGAEDGFIRGIINEISSVFASAKGTLRSALGIWHYVIEWIRSISAPFSLFLGLAGRVSPYITLPVYASIAGLVILGVYKKFIG